MKEWVKGLLAFPAVVVGVLIMWWSSRFYGIAFWSFWCGTVLGLVIAAFGMGYATEFIKLLMTGTLTKGFVAALKETVMKEWMRVFLAFFSIGAGICFFLTAEQITYYLPLWVPLFLGIVLIAGGITYFWIRSKFYRP